MFFFPLQFGLVGIVVRSIHVFACYSHVRHMVFYLQISWKTPATTYRCIIGKVPIKNQRHAVPSSFVSTMKLVYVSLCYALSLISLSAFFSVLCAIVHGFGLNFVLLGILFAENIIYVNAMRFTFALFEQQTHQSIQKWLCVAVFV